MKPSEQSVLYRTSSASDVKNSNGYLTLTGMFPVKKTLIKLLRQVMYRAEVAQVITVGGVNTSWTPLGGTTYKISVWDRNRRVSGYSEQPKFYLYTTTADLVLEGTTAALQREYINGKIVTAINNDNSNRAVALSSGSGNGFTITDDGGYYPAKSQTMSNIRFVNEVEIISGYAESNQATTTAGVTQNGVGAKLAEFAPVVDFMTGNLISGSLVAPPLTVQASGGAPGLPAVSGQNYDAFVVVSLNEVPAHSEGNNKVCYINQIQTAWVDNGTGSSTTNLTGFLAFERQFHKEMAFQYQNDANAICEFFDKGYVMQANPGVTPYTGTLASTADVMKFFTTPYGTKLEQYNINAQTIFAPLEVAGGLQIEQDVTATDGAHYCAGTLAFAPNSFIVGKQPFALYTRVVAGDWTDAFAMIGFRNKAVYDANYTTYDDLGAIGTRLSAVGDVVATQGNINNGTTVETASATVIATDSTSVKLIVKVAVDGTVTAFRNGTSFPIYSAGTTTLDFTDGDEMIPFVQFINVNSSASTFTISEFIAVADTELIS